MATRKKGAKKPASRSAKAKARPKAKAAAKAKPAARAKPRAKASRAKSPAKPVLKRRKEPQTLRLRGASPSLTVNDLEKSIAFYRDVVGFVVQDRWMNEGKLAGVGLLAGKTYFMIGQDDWKKGRDRVKGVGFRIYCTTTQDVDAIASRIKSRGGTLDEEPTDHSWGRSFGFTDPDGFKITIGNENEKS